MNVEVDVAAGAGNMLDDCLKRVTDIPFELVDDEEMAAIESAFLHAQSIASAYHSKKNAQVSFGSNWSHPLKNSSCSVNMSSTILSTSNLYKEQQQSLVCTATSSLTGEEKPYSAALNSSYGLSDKICASQIYLDVALPQGDVGEWQSGCHPTVTVAPDEVSAGIAGGDGTVVMSTVDIMMVSSQDATPVTKAYESDHVRDIEDTGAPVALKPNAQKISRPLSLLLRHRAKRGLSVTDFTASEWCEKQVEFSMTRGKPESTPAMKVGSERHVQLEVEVVTRIDIEIHTKEDAWATRLLNFISGSRQLLSQGITRELPVSRELVVRLEEASPVLFVYPVSEDAIDLLHSTKRVPHKIPYHGLLAGTWIVGIIDEIRLVERDGQEYPLLVDTKTRGRKSPPAEPQKRNARLQLMSYKYLWDSLVETGLPFEALFQHFGLRPHQKLCSDVRSHASSFYQEYEIKCLQDLLPQITNEIVNYPISVNTLLLRYEWQADQSLLGEDEFVYEHEWLMDRWQWHLEFWKGHRRAFLVPEDETWKCRHCSFASICKPVKPSTSEHVT